LTALAQQAELPATWTNSFASWKASIAAAILVQVLGEAVLSRVFKHCGHCTPPGLKATMHLPQHPHRIRYGFLLLRELFLWCQLPSASSWTMLSEIEKRGIKISIFYFCIIGVQAHNAPGKEITHGCTESNCCTRFSCALPFGTS
jgi:hypothetical protein